jgi:hypothetical protein
MARWVRANARAFAIETVLEYLALAPLLGLVLVWWIPGPPPETGEK